MMSKVKKKKPMKSVNIKLKRKKNMKRIKAKHHVL